MIYIVKNCPCAYGFVDAPMYCPWKDETLTYNTLCQDCTDCVIKRVIEIAKDIIEKDFYEPSDVKAEKILQLFDIEELNK